MRKLTLLMIIFWSILALLIVTALVVAIVVPGSIGIIGGADGPTAIYTTERIADAELLFDQSYPVDQVETLRIDLSFDDITILPSESGDMRVVQHGVNLREEHIITVENRASTLTVKRPLRTGIQLFNWNNNIHSTVEVYLPHSYHNALELDLTSGSILIADDRIFARVSVDLTSGGVETKRIEADSIRVDITSGHIRFHDLAVRSFVFDSTSGSLNVGSLTGSGSIDSTSGDIQIDRLALDESLSIDLTSGNANVGLVGDPSVQLRGSSTSGNINVYFGNREQSSKRNFNITTGAGPYKQITVDITSGNVNIRQVE